MNETQIMTLDCLLHRLENVLGTDSLLFKRFERGLQREDERCLTDAMNSLALYPPATRRLVEDTVMSWLFGNRSAARDLMREA